MKIFFTYILFFVIAMNSFAQDKIKWVTLNEALELQKKNPKKIMMDVYTNWCGPCKLLDKNTFGNKDLIKYVNENYYAVKFNGEGNEIIEYDGNSFSNPNYDPKKAKTRNSSHQFADYMRLRGYPTIVFFDEKGSFLIPLTGYYEPQQLELYLKLFKNDKHKEISSKEDFNKYYKDFKPEFRI